MVYSVKSLIKWKKKTTDLKLILLVNGRLVQRAVAEESVDVVAGVEALHLVGRAARPRTPRRHRLHVADLYI